MSQQDEFRETMCHLTHAVSALTVELVRATKWHRSHSEAVTQCDLDKLENKIMSVISDYLGKQKNWNTRQEAAVDSVVASQIGLVEDIKALNDKITELQNSSGGVTAEDQILINEAEAQGEALVTKAEGVAAALKALDESTPPVVPPVPPA